MKTTPLTPILAAEGAEFTVVNGWERVDFIKPTADFHPTLSYKFDEAFDVVGAEVADIHDHVGLTEVNGFNRFEITGNAAHDFLDRMIRGRVTHKTGKVGLGYLLNHQGMLKGEATIANLPDGRIWYGSAAASEFHDMDWLQAHIQTGEDVQIRSLTNAHTILVLAGPKARDVLAAVSRADWPKDAFPWLSVSEAFIGIASAVVMLNDQVVGTVTSGDWGHRVGKNLAYAFVNPEQAAVGTLMTIDILGDLVPATVIKTGPYDPSYSRVRG